MNLPWEYWIGLLLAIDFILVVLLWHAVRTLKQMIGEKQAGGGAPREPSGQILAMLEPLVKEANQVALAFERQLEEKSRLIHRLNERLDSRIISLNLLLNRADTYLGKTSGTHVPAGDQVYEQQKAILELHQKGADPIDIAKKLGVPKGEVELVVHLKRHALEIDQKL